MKSLRSISIASIIFALCGTCFSQVATGVPPFTSTGGGNADVINLANLNVHITVPVFSKPGRGMGFSYAPSYDTSVWTVSGNTWQPVDMYWGWQQIYVRNSGGIFRNARGVKCYDDPDLGDPYYW